MVQQVFGESHRRDERAMLSSENQNKVKDVLIKVSSTIFKMNFLKYFSAMILLGVVKSDSEDICQLKSSEGTSENDKSFNDIKIQEFPFVASYGQNSKNWIWTHECTASVLTKKTLLTAAHCLKTFDKQKNRVIVGENDLNSDSPSISKQEISISHVARHPDYDNVTAYF